MAMRYGVVLVVIAVMLERIVVYHEEMQEINEAQAHSPSAFVAHHLLKPQSTHPLNSALLFPAKSMETTNYQAQRTED